MDGKRVETRILRKVNTEDGGWVAMSYAWNAAQDEAVAAPSNGSIGVGIRKAPRRLRAQWLEQAKSALESGADGTFSCKVP